jgi:hypothetical protein
VTAIVEPAPLLHARDKRELAATQSTMGFACAHVPMAVGRRRAGEGGGGGGGLRFLPQPPYAGEFLVPSADVGYLGYFEYPTRAEKHVVRHVQE